MKKLIYIISAALLIAGCNFLDFDETSALYDRDDMYSTYSNIQKMLTNIYGYMPNKDIVDISDAMRDCGSDDAEFGDPSATVQRYNNGNWSALQTVDTKWSLYNGIRSANEFLESIQDVDISRYRYDSKYNQWLQHLALYPYEARTLRAYYLFELARRYGDIPVPTTMLSVSEANSIGKTPFDDFVLGRADCGTWYDTFVVPTEALEPLKELCHALQDKMWEVKLKEDNMRRDLMKELDMEREEIYNEGVKRGRNLLAQLNSGEITVRELNERQVYKKTKEE